MYQNLAPTVPVMLHLLRRLCDGLVMLKGIRILKKVHTCSASTILLLYYISPSWFGNTCYILQALSSSVTIHFEEDTLKYWISIDRRWKESSRRDNETDTH